MIWVTAHLSILEILLPGIQPLLPKAVFSNSKIAQIRLDAFWPQRLGPKSRAKEGPGEAKVASDRRRGQDGKVEPLSRVILSVRAMVGN